MFIEGFTVVRQHAQKRHIVHSMSTDGCVHAHSVTLLLLFFDSERFTRAKIYSNKDSYIIFIHRNVYLKLFFNRFVFTIVCVYSSYAYCMFVQRRKNCDYIFLLAQKVSRFLMNCLCDY